MVGGLDKGVVANQDQQGRSHTSLGLKVNRSGGVGKGNNKAGPHRQPWGCGSCGIRRGFFFSFFFFESNFIVHSI